MRAVVAVIMLLIAAFPAKAENIALALTDDSIAVDTGFSGARVTLFGVVTGEDDPEKTVDIIAVIRGPITSFRIRPYEKTSFIWTPGRAHLIENAPGLFLTSATRAVASIAPLPDQARYGLDTDNLEISVRAEKEHPLSEEQTSDLTNAFIDEATALGIYGSFSGGVQFKKEGLFTIKISLPANTPVGKYDVIVYLYRDGIKLGADSAVLTVNRVGAERRIYELAHRRPLSYGIFCVAIALLAGWIAALAFRK